MMESHPLLRTRTPCTPPGGGWQACFQPRRYNSPGASNNFGNRRNAHGRREELRQDVTGLRTRSIFVLVGPSKEADDLPKDRHVDSQHRDC